MKMPFFQFYPLDWLRDTAKLSPEAKGYWIQILCYAWNEPFRGVYEREESAMCYELGIDLIRLEDLLDELKLVADIKRRTISNVRGNKSYVTVMSRRMVKEETQREYE